MSSISVSEFLYGPIRVSGKSRPIPGRFDQGAEVIGMLFGELRGVADADDAARRIAPEDERRKGDRGRDRFERARRHVDDQPLNLAAANLLQAVGDRLNVPGPLKFLAWTEGCERLVDEGPEIVAQQGFEVCAPQSASSGSSPSPFFGRLGLGKILRQNLPILGQQLVELNRGLIGL